MIAKITKKKKLQYDNCVVHIPITTDDVVLTYPTIGGNWDKIPKKKAKKNSSKEANVSTIDNFYPISAAITQIVEGDGDVPLTLKAWFWETLKKAKNGDLAAEEELCQRLGQIRRYIAIVPMRLFLELNETITFLRSVDRTVCIESEDPRQWISQRGGAPRW